MPLTSLGNNSFRLISSGVAFDPDVGYTTTETYEGSEDACNGQIRSFALIGCRTRIYQQDGPVFRMEVTYGFLKKSGQDSVETKWTFNREYVQVDMRNHPAFINAVAGGASTINLWIKEIDQLIKDGKTPVPGVVDAYMQIFTLRSFGQKAFEVERFVLRRSATYNKTTVRQEIIDAIPKIYTTAALIRLFFVPPAIANRLPSDPTFTPTYHKWAWKVRRCDTELIPRVSKISETWDWVFAAWPDLIYTLVT